MTKAKTEVAKLPAFLGDKTQLPAHLQNAESNAGNENIGASDIAIPRLAIVQALSAVLETNDDAKAGDIMNSVTGDLYDTVFVIPLMYRKAYSIFKKRKLGGGYEGQHETVAIAEQHLAELDPAVNAVDYDISEVAIQTCILLDEEGTVVSPVEILMSGSKLRVSKQWNAAIASKQANRPRFSGVWQFHTLKQSNTSGTWFNFGFDFCGFPDEATFAIAAQKYAEFTGTAVLETA